MASARRQRRTRHPRHRIAHRASCGALRRAGGGAGGGAVRRNGGDAWTEARVRAAGRHLRASDKILAIHKGPDNIAAVTVNRGIHRGMYEVCVFDRSSGAMTLLFESPTLRVATMEARRIATGRQPTTVEILRAYNVPQPAAFARARMAPLKEAILRELRAMRLYPYQTWEEIRDALPPEATDDVFHPDGDPPYAPQVTDLAGNERAAMDLHEAMSREIMEWLRTDAVRSLKRMGKRAFQPAEHGEARKNPRRHGGTAARRNGGAWTLERVRREVSMAALLPVVAIFEGPVRVAVVMRNRELASDRVEYTVALVDPITGRPDPYGSRYFTHESVALLMAKHYAEGTVPRTAEVLRALGMTRRKQAETFAWQRLAPIRRAVIDAMRSMQLQPYQSWDEARELLENEHGSEFVDGAFGVDGTPRYPRGIEVELSSDLSEAHLLLRGATHAELSEWMRTDAVRLLKRMGKRAFLPAYDRNDGDGEPRQNPRRRRGGR